MSDTASDFPWDTFLRNLDALEKRAGSREKLAAATSVSFWSINSWRRQDHRPDLDALMRVAEAYDLTLDDLMYGRV